MRAFSAVVVLAVVLVGGAVVPRPAPADLLTPPAPPFEPLTPQGVTAEGWPQLTAEGAGPGSSTTWRACVPRCGEVISTAPSWSPGEAVPGVRFEATTFTADRRIVRTVTREWGGRLRIEAPPVLEGAPRTGGRVRALWGSWRGGWADELRLTGVRACRTPQATDCRSLSAAGLAPMSGAEPIELDPVYAGWWIGAYERRLDATTAFPAVVLAFPSGRVSPHRAPEPGQLVAAGPLAGPVRLGFTPRTTIVRRLAGDARSAPVATIRCAGACVARVTLRGGGRTVTRRLAVPAGGSRTVAVRRASFGRARSLRVTVRFDHHPKVVRRTVRIGR